MLKKLSIITSILFVCAISFAQQTSTTRIISPTMFESGSYLGVETVEITKQNLAKYGLSTIRGVAVEKVVENSPAKSAGLQKNDVIVAINGEEVSSIRKLTRIISEIAPDHQAKFTILRNAEEREITVTLAKRPMSSSPYFDEGTLMRMPNPREGNVQIMRVPMENLGNNSLITYNEDRQIGARVMALTEQLADYFGVSERKGMLITEVYEDSPAEKVGLKAGDVIVELDGSQISNQVQLTKALMTKKTGEVSLTIVRNKNRQNVNILPSVVKRNGRIIRDEITTRY